MRKIPRTRERTATAVELEEDRRRYLAAKPTSKPISKPVEGNLCAVLVTFAAWRRCCVCGSLTLYVDENAQTDGDFECGLCVEIRENLAKRLRQTPLPARMAMHLWGLFATSNDNGEARS
jgi:hypothetical protein